MEDILPSLKLSWLFGTAHFHLNNHELSDINSTGT